MKIFYKLQLLVAETDDFDFIDMEIENAFEINDTNLTEKEIEKSIISHAEKSFNYYEYEIWDLDFYVKEIKNEKSN